MADFNNMLKEIVDRLTPSLEPQNPDQFGWRPALPISLKVAITLKFLATGDNYTNLQYSFRVAPKLYVRWSMLLVTR